MVMDGKEGGLNGRKVHSLLLFPLAYLLWSSKARRRQLAKAKAK
jgi:hypothetical protein